MRLRVLIALLTVQAVVGFAQESLTSRDLSDRIAIVTAIPGTVVERNPGTFRDDLGHTFYPDLLISPAANGAGIDASTGLLVVLPLQAPGRIFEFARRLPQTGVSLLIVAPRSSAQALAVAALDPVIGSNDRIRLLLQSGDRTEWRFAAGNSVAPRWVIEELGRGAIRSDLVGLQAAHLGIGRRGTNLQRLLDAGLPAATLTIGESAPSDLDTLADLVGEIDNRMEGANATPAGNERAYLVLGWDGQPYAIIGERPLLIGALVVVAVMLAFATFRPRALRRYLRAIGHNAGGVAALFALTAGGLIAGNLILRTEVVATAAETQAAAAILARAALTVVLVSLTWPLLHIRMRRATTAYSGTAIALLAIGTTIAAMVSIVVAAFFMASLVLAILFSLSRNSLLKSILFVAAATPGIYILATFATAGDPAITTALMTPPLWRDAAVATLVLPLLLMFFRVNVLMRRIPMAGLLALAAALSLAFSVAVLVAAPADSATPVTATLESAPADSQEHSPPVFEVELAEALNRRVLSMSWSGAEEVRSSRVRIETSSPVQLYASEIPPVQDTGARATTFTFDPGPYPPPSFTWSVVILAPDDPVEATVTLSSVTVEGTSQLVAELLTIQ